MGSYTHLTGLIQKEQNYLSRETHPGLSIHRPLTAKSAMCLIKSPGICMIIEDCWKTHFWSYNGISGLASCSFSVIKSYLHGVNSV